jgi:hypothetical protein
MKLAPGVLEQRMPEVGRIRYGDVQPTSNGKTRPNKLDRFRLTTNNEAQLIQLATVYGGEPRRWETAPGPGTQYELYVEKPRLIVLVPPTDTVSQAYELWSKKDGCVRRCNGIAMGTGEPCICRVEMAEGAASQPQCKLTTHVSFWLQGATGLSTWRLTSHGTHMAAEMPGMVELLSAATSAGVPQLAALSLVSRTAKVDGAPAQFFVPQVDSLAPFEDVLAVMSGGQLASGTNSGPGMPVPLPVVQGVVPPIPVQIGQPPVAALSAGTEFVTPAWVRGVERRMQEAGFDEPMLAAVITHMTVGRTVQPTQVLKSESGILDKTMKMLDQGSLVLVAGTNGGWVVEAKP